MKLKCPYYHPSVKTIFDKANEKQCAHIKESLAMIQTLGHIKGHSRKIRDKIYELKTGGNTIRVFYMFFKGDVRILLVYLKSTSKIPTKVSRTLDALELRVCREVNPEGYILVA